MRLCNGLAIEHPEQKPRSGVLPVQTDGQVGTKAGLCALLGGKYGCILVHFQQINIYLQRFEYTYIYVYLCPTYRASQNLAIVRAVDMCVKIVTQRQGFV